MAPKYFSSILCVKISADDRGIHNASCENRTPCVFPSQVLTPVNLPRGDVNGPLAQDLVRKGQVHELKELMKKSTELGMQTFDQALYDLYDSGEIPTKMRFLMRIHLTIFA